jgi:putative membrane protein
VTVPEKHSSNELAEDRTQLAAMRTGMAADRTLMGWVRTGMSMITFGFTVYKLLQEAQERGMVLPRETTPRNVGLFLIAVGTLSMILGKVEYWHTLLELKRFHPFRIWRPSFIIALLMSLAGLVLFLGIVSRAF